MSRNKENLNNSDPELEKVLSVNAPAGCVFDGEEVGFFNVEGRSDFQRLQARMQAADREEAQESLVKVHCYLFDCLY